MTEAAPAAEAQGTSTATTESEPPPSGGGEEAGGRGSTVAGGLVVAVLGGLSKDPVSLTKDGQITHAYEDPIWGPHGAETIPRDIAATFGYRPPPPWWAPEEAHKSNPAFVVGIAIGVTGLTFGAGPALGVAVLLTALYMGAEQKPVDR